MYFSCIIYVGSLKRTSRLLRALSFSSTADPNCVCGLVRCVPELCPAMKYDAWAAIDNKDNELAPYMGCDWDTIDAALDLAKVSDSSSLLDLGCGDGRILIRAYQRGAKYVEGWELNKSVFELARKHIDHALSDPSHRSRIKLLFGDLRQSIPKNFDVVTMYLIPSGLKIVEDWIKNQILECNDYNRRPVSIITIGWKFSSIKPVESSMLYSGGMIYKYLIYL